MKYCYNGNHVAKCIFSFAFVRAEAAKFGRQKGRKLNTKKHHHPPRPLGSCNHAVVNPQISILAFGSVKHVLQNVTNDIKHVIQNAPNVCFEMEPTLFAPCCNH
jgi:hypothetical protein